MDSKKGHWSDELVNARPDLGSQAFDSAKTVVSVPENPDANKSPGRGDIPPLGPNDTKLSNASKPWKPKGR